jgi:nitroreductase
MSEFNTPTIIQENRKPEFPVHPLIISRYSPRSLTGEHMPADDLMSMFEAARWAASSFNNQPWKFLYAFKNTPEWDIFFNLMDEFNQSWAKNASALVLVLSYQKFYHNLTPSQTHQFDTGNATANFALQATALGYIAHFMQGFDYEKAQQDLHIPNDYDIYAMIAVGKHNPDLSQLPEKLHAREIPSTRKSVQEIAFNGVFPE